MGRSQACKNHRLPGLTTRYLTPPPSLLPYSNDPNLHTRTHPPYQPPCSPKPVCFLTRPPRFVPDAGHGGPTVQLCKALPTACWLWALFSEGTRHAPRHARMTQCRFGGHLPALTAATFTDEGPLPVLGLVRPVRFGRSGGPSGACNRVHIAYSQGGFRA